MSIEVRASAASDNLPRLCDLLVGDALDSASMGAARDQLGGMLLAGEVSDPDTAFVLKGLQLKLHAWARILEERELAAAAPAVTRARRSWWRR